MKVQCIPVPEKKCWKLKSLEKGTKGKVIGYRQHIVLAQAEYKVDTIKRDKFIRSKTPEVHHWIEGYVIVPSESPGDTTEDRIAQSARVIYRPYEHQYWATEHFRHPVGASEVAYLVGSKVFAYKIARD